jgi:hypothetical protein
MIRSWFCISFTVVPLIAAGCSSASPTTPTRAFVQPIAASQTHALADSSLNGSAYRLTGVDGTSLSFTNAQNSYTIAYDTDTTFRRAALQSWSPGDPYYSAAVAYNTGGLVDSFLLSPFIGGNVRIVLLPPNPVFPNDPIRILSFQPIP